MAGYLRGLDTVPPAGTDPEVPTVTAEQQRTEKSLRTARTLTDTVDTMPEWLAVALAERQRREESRLAVALAERQRREESLSASDKWKIAGFVAFVCAVVAVFVWLIVWLPTVLPSDPRYAVTVDDVSGLTSNRTDLALDPEFNLTLRVTSESSHHSACVEPGTYLEVAYRCVTLATSATAKQRLCAGPRWAAEHQLVAKGTRMRVPGAVLDSLAADMLQGELVFQVTIRWSGDNDADDMLVALCGGRRVGAADDDLGTSCDAWHHCPKKTNDGSH